MRAISFRGDISKAKIVRLLESLQSDHGRSLVVVDSPGGEFEFFSQLAPPLARAGFVSVGVRVASAAIVLQLLGAERLAVPDATFFFHEVRTIIGSNGEVSVYDLERALDIEREMKNRLKLPEREFLEHWYSQMVSAQSWMFSFIAKQTGFPPGRFVNLMRNNVTLSAREAVQYGVVQRIISADEYLALVNS